MEPKRVEVLGLDSFSGQEFIVYFSDNTYATVTAEALAECFPHRQEVPEPEEE